MKKKIIILGSTGSIGKNTIKIIKKDKKNFNIILLSTNKNVSEIIKQAKEFKVKNIIINNYSKFIETKKKYKKLDIKFYNSFSILDKIFKKKEIYYSMISIIGLDGLKPSLQLIKYSKNIAIVNKESIICGWNLIKKKLVKFKTNFIPIDSEHFSIYSLIQNKETKNIDRIFITASGGPFLKKTIRQLKYVKKKDALNHPNWTMGQKITIDSATLINKGLEVIEAHHLFNTPFNKIKVIIHPQSIIHSLVEFTDGTILSQMGLPDMRFPIQYALTYPEKWKNPWPKTNLADLQDLQFFNPDYNKFELLQLAFDTGKKGGTYPAVLNAANEAAVNLFLKESSKFLKKNGIMFIATLNKTLKSYFFAILGAEYVLRWLPIGTHDWNMFVKPGELVEMCKKNSLMLEEILGVKYNIISRDWELSTDDNVNYMALFKKI